MNIIAQAPNLPGSAQGASSTAIFFFKDAKNVSAIVSIPVNQVLRAITGAAGAAGSHLSSLSLVKRFTVRAGGRVIGATAGNFTVQLHTGIDDVAGSSTPLGSSGALALATDSSVTSWFIEAGLELSPSSSKLQGEFAAFVNGSVAARAAVTTSVEDLISSGVLNFKVTGTFSASNAGNSAVCDFLQVLQ